MTVEPMTDAELDRLRSNIFAYNRKERSQLLLSGQNVIRILARLDAERTRADRECDRVVDLTGDRAGLMLQLDDAKRALTKAEAERDAAVARAMPEPRLVRTVEEVGALTTGAYRIAAPWQPRRKWILGWRHPTGTWTLLIGAVASGVKDDHIVGSWVQRLPDLPIQEGQGNG